MSLAKEDLEQIQILVDTAISRAQFNVEPVLSNVRYDLEIRDRTLKVEEELKHQRDLLTQGFQAMEKRFEAADKRFEAIDKRFEDQSLNFNKRFEAIDKRFEEQSLNFNKRFEAIDKRFEEQSLNFNKRFEEQTEIFNKRFEQQRNETIQRFEYMEKQFEAMRQDMNLGFTEVNRRLERFMFWTFGLVTSVTALFISFKLL